MSDGYPIDETGRLPAPGSGGTRRATGMGVPGRLPSDAAGNGRAADAREAASEKLAEAAEKLRDVARRASAKNELLGRAAPAARRVAGSLDGAADYVRVHDFDAMRRDIEDQVRRHPLPSLLVAFGAGVLLRRLFR